MAVEVSADTIIDKVFACFKKITPALVAVSLASAAILFLPTRSPRKKFDTEKRYIRRDSYGHSWSKPFRKVY